MCVVCGCGEPGAAGAGPGRTAGVDGAGRGAPQAVGGGLQIGPGAARVSVPGMDQARVIRLEADILGANQRVAAQNRARFAAQGVTALNLVSSPGSGKTTLLCATIAALEARYPALPVAVIEGDQQTSLDAERIRATGAAAVQVNTGQGCHLDAPMVAQAFALLRAARPAGHDRGPALLFIENVGNLVCPALWDLGEAAKVVILSVTEGEDKPLKYPDMFAAARLMLLNKTDLLPHLRFDLARCIALARQVNPALEVIALSAATGEGLDDWLHWLAHAAGIGHGHGAHPVAHDHGHDGRHGEDGHGHGHGHGDRECRRDVDVDQARAAETEALRARVRQLEAELARVQAGPRAMP